MLTFKQTAAAALFAGLLIGTGCGKRRPPQPPVERVAQTVDISGTQIGTQINLVWQMPARNAAGGNALNISRADIYRLAEPLDASLSLTEEEFAANSTLIASIPLSDSDFALKQKEYFDTLQFAGQQARLRYAVRFVNSSGQKAAFSNFFLIEPTSRVALQPSDLTGVVSQEQISIKWTAPPRNQDGTTPANILGYNLYRRIGSQGEIRKLNDSPINADFYLDTFFEFDASYTYTARTVSLGGGGLPVESASSTELVVTAKDTFAPAAPESLTIAASPNSISIFFATNIETDVIGYKVYRSTEPAKPKSDWDLLTPAGIKTNTFQDSKVQPGVKYYYYLTATDRYGNVSKSSEVVSETSF